MKKMQDMTIEELEAEQKFWQAKIDSAAAWGAAVGAAAEFRDDCERMIRRKRAEK